MKELKTTNVNSLPSLVISRTRSSNPTKNTFPSAGEVANAVTKLECPSPFKDVDSPEAIEYDKTRPPAEPARNVPAEDGDIAVIAFWGA